MPTATPTIEAALSDCDPGQEGDNVGEALGYDCAGDRYEYLRGRHHVSLSR
jgi:hypothetical protein